MSTAGWEDGWSELEVRALHEGDEISPRETVHDDRGRLRAVRPSGDGLPGLHGAAHARHAQRQGGGRGGARQAHPLLPGAPRPLAGADRRRLGRPRRGRDRRLDRRAGLVVGRARGGHRAPCARGRLRGRHGRRRAPVRRPLPRRDQHHRPRGLRERLGPHRARGGRRAGRAPVGRSPGHQRAARRRRAAATSPIPTATAASRRCWPAACATRSTPPGTGTCGSSSRAASMPRRSRASRPRARRSTPTASAPRCCAGRTTSPPTSSASTAARWPRPAGGRTRIPRLELVG